jgi:ATP-dependent DNA helicase DinG
MERQRHLVVQAGTGTGKSLAYLVPAALAGQRVVVATATKALQDQLAGKDLPKLATSLDTELTFALLKGRSNYVCVQRVSEVGGSGEQLSLDPAGIDPPDTDGTLIGDGSGQGSDDGNVSTFGTDDSTDDIGRLGDQIRRLVRWAQDSPTGDRAELPFEPHFRAWAAVSTTARECPGAYRCPSGQDCFAEAARDRAASADVVVVNTHLYGAHLASDGAVLPPHELVIFDEAHEIEEIMTSSLGLEIGPGRFRALASVARGVVGSDRTGPEAALDSLSEVGDQLREALRPFVGKRIPKSALVNGSGGSGDDQGSATISGSDRGLSDLLNLATGRLDHLISLLRQAEREAGDDEPTADRTRRDRVLLAAGHLSEDLRRLMAIGDDDVPWVDGGQRMPVLRVSPIDVAPLLAERLWDTTTAILTSATVPVGLVERLGLPADQTDQTDVGSPFDYRDNSLLYVAKSLPDRRRPESEPALHNELEVLINAAGGRTLALFTSWRAMNAALEALRPRLAFTLLAQADLPKPALVEAFRTQESTCLFATLGFWQGVDLPGRTLSLVTIDRIPFPRPDEPVLQARRDRAGARAFAEVDLPRAGTLLAQGAGRLIRTADDRGVVAVLDSRLATASYRGSLLARVPPMKRTLDRTEVVEFLATISAGS